MKPSRILVIDNYDSFTYNLVHLLQECGHEATVWRNDRFDLKDIESFDNLLLSPGPGIPSEAGRLIDVIRTYGSRKNILGICLGLQAIAEVYGAQLFNLKKPEHGTATPIRVLERNDSLFVGLPETFTVGRYHSWAVSSKHLPETLKITSVDEQGIIMSLSHKQLNIQGVQFHPESIMTEYGKELIMNWLATSQKS